MGPVTCGKGHDTRLWYGLQRITGHLLQKRTINGTKPRLTDHLLAPLQNGDLVGVDLPYTKSGPILADVERETEVTAAAEGRFEFFNDSLWHISMLSRGRPLQQSGSATANFGGWLKARQYIFFGSGAGHYRL